MASSGSKPQMKSQTKATPAKGAGSADKNASSGQKKISSFFTVRPATPKAAAAEGEGGSAAAAVQGEHDT